MRYLDQQKDKKQKGGKSKTEREAEKKKADDSTYENVYYPSHKVQCDSCEKDISKFTKVVTGDSDYCVGCFACLEEAPETYQIINKLSFPLFEAEWSAEEELLMFEGLERHGFGNWNEIAEHIGTDKTKQEVQRHYEDVYLSGKDFLPTDKQLLSRRDERTLRLVAPKSSGRQEGVKRTRRIKESEPQSAPLGGGRVSVNNPTNNSQSVINTGQANQIVGYIPKRGQFEVEYDNDAELLLAEMQFNDDDTEQERNMKYRLLDIYNYKLNERRKRKEFVISRQLLDVKYQNQLEKNRSRDERQIYNMMKVFARFNTPEQHEKLVEGIIREKQIRQRIQQLKLYKKLGLKTFAQVEEYLEEKRKKDEQKLKKQKTTENNFYYDNKIKNNVSSRRTRTTASFEGSKPQKRNQFVTADETKICEKLDLPIPHYIAIKETLVRQCVKEGFIRRDKVDEMLRLDKEKVLGVFDFLVTNNTLLSK